VNFPYVHDLAELLMSVEKVGQEVPELIRQAERLSKFCGVYPIPRYWPIYQGKGIQTLEIAARVVKWAENIVSPKRRK